MLHVKFEIHRCNGFREKTGHLCRTLHLGFSSRLTFTGLKTSSLITLHVKFEIHRCSGFREKVIKMDLKARVDVHCERKDGRTENRTPMSHTAKAGATESQINPPSLLSFNTWLKAQHSPKPLSSCPHVY